MFEKVPLQIKFAAIPFLCVAVLLMMSFAFATVVTLQKTVMDQVSGSIVNRSQMAIDGHVNLSRLHVAVVDILTHATTGRLDEEQVFVAGEHLLAELAESQAIVDELIELFSQSDQEISLVGEIEKHLATYKISAASAIEMSTVDSSLAGEELLDANISYDKLDEIFLQLIELAKFEMRSSLDDLSVRSHQIQTWIIIATAFGVGGTIVVSIAIYLSISKGMRVLIRAMLTLADGVTEISIPKIQSKDELGDMAEALVVFRSNAQALNAALDKERELSSLQRQFVSMVSHEFRTPLAIIDGNAQRVERRPERITPERMLRIVKTIRQSVVRLTDLMESVLSASRLEEGRISFSPVECELNAIVAEICASYAELNPDHQLIVNLDEDLAGMIGDKTLLRQIVSNLISNAVKYSPAGSRVWIDTTPLPEETVQLSIRDEGVGIPKDEQKKLFERFFRASSSTGIAGTGIGLHLAGHLASLHGGTIDFDSVEGEGTTFRLQLPLVLKRNAAQASSDESIEAAASVQPITSPLQHSTA